MISFVLTFFLGVIGVLMGHFLKIGFLEIFLVEWLIFYAFINQKYKSGWVLLMTVILLRDIFSVMNLWMIGILYVVWFVSLVALHYILVEGGLIYNLVVVGVFGLVYWVVLYGGLAEGFWFWWSVQTIVNFGIFQGLTLWGNKNRLYEIIYT